MVPTRASEQSIDSLVEIIAIFAASTLLKTHKVFAAPTPRVLATPPEVDIIAFSRQPKTPYLTPQPMVLIG
jgi:hypothetical protein